MTKQDKLLAKAGNSPESMKDPFIIQSSIGSGLGLQDSLRKVSA